MKTYITSDLHFGHQNIIKYCPNTRGHFQNADEMNDEMTKNWNEIVKPDDLVYILGDVAFMYPYRASQLVRSLNGRKILIEGNHDQKNLKDPMFCSSFDEIHKYLEINFDGQKICMFHYPIKNWNQCHRGSIHFHGHCHGDVTGLEHLRALDVGYDATGRIVVELGEMVRRALEKTSVSLHHQEHV